MIILFGSYARGTAVDMDIHEDWDKCNKLNLSARPGIIAHDIEYLNIQLAQGQFFFSDIKKEGILLYDSKKSKLANKRRLTKKICQQKIKSWSEVPHQLGHY